MKGVIKVGLQAKIAGVDQIDWVGTTTTSLKQPLANAMKVLHAYVHKSTLKSLVVKSIVKFVMFRPHS